MPWRRLWGRHPKSGDLGLTRQPPSYRAFAGPMPPGGLRPPWAAWGPGSLCRPDQPGPQRTHAAKVALVLALPTVKSRHRGGLVRCRSPLAKPPVGCITGGRDRVSGTVKAEPEPRGPRFPSRSSVPKLAPGLVRYRDCWTRWTGENRFALGWWWARRGRARPCCWLTGWQRARSGHRRG